MKAMLHAAKQDWQVWTIWYDDRLEGRVRDKTRELAYVRIEEALWDQGPAVVNAEIERRIAMSSYEDRLRGRTTDLAPELASERIEEAISGQGQATEDAEAFTSFLERAFKNLAAHSVDGSRQSLRQKVFEDRSRSTELF
jgi:2,3-bisphosphoglycerate-independent phosphoglycerate mutase